MRDRLNPCCKREGAQVTSWLSRARQATAKPPPSESMIMINSVRIRLTLWYTAAMAAVLIVLAAATYFVLGKNVVRRADAQAIELADSFLTTVNAELRDVGKPDSGEEGIAAAIAEHKFNDVVFAVFGARGELLGLSERFRLQDPNGVPTKESFAGALRPLASESQAFR